jgi:hypothetical protein
MIRERGNGANGGKPGEIGLAASPCGNRLPPNDMNGMYATGMN